MCSFPSPSVLLGVWSHRETVLYFHQRQLANIRWPALTRTHYPGWQSLSPLLFKVRVNQCETRLANYQCLVIRLVFTNQGLCGVLVSTSGPNKAEQASPVMKLTHVEEHTLRSTWFKLAQCKMIKRSVHPWGVCYRRCARILMTQKEKWPSVHKSLPVTCNQFSCHAWVKFKHRRHADTPCHTICLLLRLWFPFLSQPVEHLHFFCCYVLLMIHDDCT